MTFRLNPDRFRIIPDAKKAEAIEKFIKQSINKFFRSNVLKTKTQALLEEIEGFYARNVYMGRPNLCSFEIYIQHWTEAARGIIQDIYLDLIEEQFGRLEGLLHLQRGHSTWYSEENFR